MTRTSRSRPASAASVSGDVMVVAMFISHIIASIILYVIEEVD